MNLICLIVAHAVANGIPPLVALSVAQVESGYKVNAIGSHGEVGLFQLLPSSFPSHSRDRLILPKVNIKEGIRYLAQMKRQCPHRDRQDWVSCFNLGVAGAARLKHPNRWPYVLKVETEMAKKDWKWELGTRLWISGIRANNNDGPGIFRGTPVDPHHQAYALIETEEGLRVAVAYDRCVTEEAYWAEVRRKRGL